MLDELIWLLQQLVYWSLQAAPVLFFGMIVGGPVFAVFIMPIIDHYLKSRKRTKKEESVKKKTGYKLLRKKIKEKKWDEITEEEQEIINEAIITIIEAFMPIIEQMLATQAELLGLFDFR